MPESFYFQSKESKKKKNPEMDEEELELTESPESKELREGFARELKNPHEGSYFKKLQRIAAAFALAGLVSLAAPEKAIPPEKSKDFKELEMLNYYRETNQERYFQILDALSKSVKEKGGVEVSPQLPEEVYKPKALAEKAKMEIGQSGIPYFSKPEIIFGEEFIKKNPDKAKEYFEKISKAQKATVIVSNNMRRGSGVIINTEKGKIILTNEHAVRLQINTWVEFINGNIVEAKVLDTDLPNDMAILKIDLPEDVIEKKEVLKGTDSLDLDLSAELKPGEELALIGYPMGYPFEVSLAKVENVETESVEENGQDSFIATKIISRPDERFTKLATYETSEKVGRIAHKGENIWGMSGGPIIKLDGKGEPRLVGINRGRRGSEEDFSYFAEGTGMHSQVIGKFLEKSGYPASVSQK